MWNCDDWKKICLFVFFLYIYLVSKCWPFLTEGGGSKDAIHYKLGVSFFKCEDWCQDSYHTLKLDIINPRGKIAAARLKDIEFGFSCLNLSFTPSFHEGSTVPSQRWVNVSNCRL